MNCVTLHLVGNISKGIICSFEALSDNFNWNSETNLPLCEWLARIIILKIFVRMLQNSCCYHAMLLLKKQGVLALAS
jgi:hypothetical protein